MAGKRNPTAKPVNPNKQDKSTRSITLPIVLLDLVDLLVDVTDAKSRREVLVRLLLDEADYLILELQSVKRDDAALRLSTAAGALEAAEGEPPPGALGEAAEEEVEGGDEA